MNIDLEEIESWIKAAELVGGKDAVSVSIADMWDIVERLRDAERVAQTACTPIIDGDIDSATWGELNDEDRADANEFLEAARAYHAKYIEPQGDDQ